MNILLCPICKKKPKIRQLSDNKEPEIYLIFCNKKKIIHMEANGHSVEEVINNWNNKVKKCSTP